MDFAGKTIAHYKILEKLGEGGMGVVYLAQDTNLFRKVALKFLASQVATDSDTLERFQQEARVIAALNHPNIVTIYDIGECDGLSYIAMEYIEGQTLRSIIESNADTFVPLQQAFDITIQLCDGLHEAHNAEIVHRDLKPGNIVVDKAGRVKVLDFGLAKLMRPSILTRKSVVMGTIDYMSPEQLQGLPVDHRSDIWSFSVTFYELLTQFRPFQTDYEQATLYSIVNEEPVPLSERRADIPPELDQMIHLGLQKDPEERPQSFLEIKSFLQDMTNSSEVRTAFFPKKLKHKRPAVAKWVSLGLGLLLSLVIVAVVLMQLLPVKEWLSDISIPDEKHLVVLPFENIAKTEEDQIFCDGLVETITSKITEMEGARQTLWVVPSREIRSRDINSVSEAQKVFGANLVITGSFQQLDEKIRLTMNLIDAKNMRQLRSVIITNDPDSTVNFQDRLIDRLSNFLALELEPAERHSLAKGSTAVPGAWEFYVQGRGYLQRPDKAENIDSAIHLFGQALERDPLFALAHEGLALSYWHKYHSHKNETWYGLALEEAKTALKLDSRDANIRVTLGRIYFDASQYEQAESEFKQALRLNQKNTDAHIALAKTYTKLGKHKEAETYFKAAIQLKPAYWISYNTLGNYYLDMGRFDEAVAQFQQVTKLTPDNIWGFNNLGAAYLRTGQFQDALTMFEHSIKINPNYRAYSNLGILYHFQQNYQKAIEAYEEALAINDSDYRVWGNLAEAYSKSGSEQSKIEETYKVSVKMAEKQREIRPNDPDLLADMAGYYANLGEKQKAADLIGRVLKSGTEDVYHMYLGGYIYEKIGQRKKAIEWICNALENGYPVTELEQDDAMQALRADENFNCVN